MDSDDQKYFVVGQRVWPSSEGVEHMPGLKPGKVTKIVDEHVIEVLVDGRNRPQRYGRHVWR